VDCRVILVYRQNSASKFFSQLRHCKLLLKILLFTFHDCRSPHSSIRLLLFYPTLFCVIASVFCQLQTVTSRCVTRDHLLGPGPSWIFSTGSLIFLIYDFTSQCRFSSSLWAERGYGWGGPWVVMPKAAPTVAVDFTSCIGLVHETCCQHFFYFFFQYDRYAIMLLYC